MPWAAAAAATAVVAGNYMQGQQAKKAGDAAAQAQRDAAEAARFRPYGVTTGAATSSFGDNTATYTLTPEYQNLRNYFMGQATAGQADTNTLLGLGREYISASPEAARQEYIMQQRGLLAPARNIELNKIKESLQRTGRGGLAVGQGGQLAAANPELQAYYNSIQTQEERLAANAEQEARARTAYGQGLLSSAYSPITAPLGYATSIEELGKETINMGSALGGAQAQAGANVARGLIQASQTQQQASSWSPWGTVLSGLGQSYLGGSFGSMGGGGGGSTPTYKGPSYGTNSSFDNSWFDTNSYD
jgi:hypothetical protein